MLVKFERLGGINPFPIHCLLKIDCKSIKKLFRQMIEMLAYFNELLFSIHESGNEISSLNLFLL